MFSSSLYSSKYISSLDDDADSFSKPTVSSDQIEIAMSVKEKIENLREYGNTM